MIAKPIVFPLTFTLTSVVCLISLFRGEILPAILFGIFSLCLVAFSRKAVLIEAWPFVRKETYEQTRRERNLMMEALRDANAELYKHRKLIAGLRAGHSDVTEALGKIFKS